MMSRSLMTRMVNRCVMGHDLAGWSDTTVAPLENDAPHSLVLDERILADALSRDRRAKIRRTFRKKWQDNGGEGAYLPPVSGFPGDVGQLESRCSPN